MAGTGGFVLVFGLNLVNGNDPGRAVIGSLVAALAFAIFVRFFMRSTYTQLHQSLYEKQVAAAQAAAEEANAAEEQQAVEQVEAAEETPEPIEAEPAPAA
ncbi:MAG: hypothetical protein CMO74_02810 [Verrucomicrobiales bacterium]|nr:hypothetical protein [Verrucomicrobiales bacterium]